jgi:luciferase-type oxidoreductase
MERINAGFARMFAPGRTTLGLMFPIEAFEGAEPTMEGQVELAQRAEAAGFAALWFRDVPLLDPGFGDIGQVYDPWTYLGFIAAQTRAIALTTGAIILPLRHPLHTAKAAASIDHLSRGRLVLGVASGDRVVEYPAFGRPFEQRGALFRESLRVVRRALAEPFPRIESPFGLLEGAAVVPKAFGERLPLLVTGCSQQSLEWIAEHSDGWVTYPRRIAEQARVAERWRLAVEERGGGAEKPFAQSLYIDLAARASDPPVPIHLGFRLGAQALIELLASLRSSGVHHVALNVKYGRRPAPEVLEELAASVLPHFPVP